jgi:uridylate kinase
VKYETLTYSDVLKKSLRVMDAAAISLARDNNKPIIVLNMKIPANIKKAMCGEHVGTIVQ